MGRHSKGEDMNTKPLDSNATSEQKAKEFDQQWGQNANSPKSISPNLDAHRKAKGE